jgi:hypothetical protein
MSRLQDRVCRFFCAPIDLHEPVPIKGALERKPNEFIYFYQCSLALSLALVVARIPVVGMALRWYGRCEAGRPLAAWLLTDALLALLQGSLRAGLLKYLPSVDVQNRAANALLVLSSRGARMSSKLSTLHFVWTLVGILWGLEAVETECPLRTATRFMAFSTVLRTLVILAYYFLSVTRKPNRRLIKYSKAKSETQLCGSSCTSCAVCYGDFTEGQELEIFACRHAFCSSCASSWLQVRRVCPMCLRSV